MNYPKLSNRIPLEAVSVNENISVEECISLLDGALARRDSQFSMFFGHFLLALVSRLVNCHNFEYGKKPEPFSKVLSVSTWAKRNV